MRPVPARWAEIVSTSHIVITQVTSWYAETYPLGEIPILSGSITFDDSAVLKRRLTLSVPAREGENDWDPEGKMFAPLAANGQWLHVHGGIRAGEYDPMPLIDLGWYLITESGKSEDGRTIEVTAVDLAQHVVDSRLMGNLALMAGATTFKTFIRDLVIKEELGIDLGMPEYDPALVDRPTASMSFEIGTQREQILDTLCSAWPARWHITDGRRVRFDAPYPDPSTVPTVKELRNGQNGTVLTRSGGQTRERIYNAVFVTGNDDDPDTPAPKGFAVATGILHPPVWGMKPAFFQSDFLTTADSCTITAENLLAKYTATVQMVTASIVPDPALQLGDVVDIEGKHYRIASITLPLTAQGGPMTITATTSLPEIGPLNVPGGRS